MPPPGDQRTLTPSELNRQVRSLLESHFDFVWVEGEISNFARPSSGHWYFTLKDDNAQVRCAMFRNRNQRLRFTPEQGDQVRLRARVSLYEGRGEFQLVGEYMEPAGAGLLQAQFDALRDRLRAEGLFDSELKQALPPAPDHLAIVTSPTGAALQDILQVLERRNPSVRITVVPSPVQGDAAATALTAALKRVNDLAARDPEMNFDAVILARGGGSLEDLWAFNDENLARAIVASTLPIVTGVGHEVDFTIADFAADARAPTPSAAAEMLSTDRETELRALERSRRALTQLLLARLAKEDLQLHALRARLRHPGDRLREQAQRLDRLEQDLQRSIAQRISQEGRRLQRSVDLLEIHNPRARVEREREQLQRLGAGMAGAARRVLQSNKLALAGRKDMLEGLNPLAILERGYAVIRSEDGSILRDSGAVKPGERVRARLARGSLGLQVEEIEDPGS